MRKVVKFGGSSLASAEQFKKVGDIIRADKGRKYVVPSAPGKRFDERYQGNGYALCMLRKSSRKKKTSQLQLLRSVKDIMEIINGLGLYLVSG